MGTLSVNTPKTTSYAFGSWMIKGKSTLTNQNIRLISNPGVG